MALCYLNGDYRVVQVGLCATSFIVNFLYLPQADILTRADKYFIEQPSFMLNKTIWVKIAKDDDKSQVVILHSEHVFINCPKGPQFTERSRILFPHILIQFFQMNA